MKSPIFLLLAAFAGSVSAATPVSDQREVPEIVCSSPTGEQIRYTSGGTGLDERARMMAEARNYNLRLTFAEKGSGHYLSDVRVKVADKQGATWIDTVSKGPWFFAKLAPGTYRVETQYGDRTESRTVQVGRGGRAHTAFYWRDADNLAARNTPMTTAAASSDCPCCNPG